MENPIIPKPVKFQPLKGAFRLTSETSIAASPLAEPVAIYLAELLQPATGYPFPVIESAEGTVASGAITLTLADNSEMPPEGYTLSATPEQIQIAASTPQGLFYGVQSLRQLLPPQIEMSSVAEDIAWMIPGVLITDSPRFKWRGLHLDVARHFFPVPFIKKFIDVMAMHKFNIFHWHLTEDQGWRIEIKKYPRLTEVGAYREASPIPADRNVLDNEPHGGFYTQDDIREVVAYAAERFVTVVPEIEMPGHATAALAAYPALGCVGEGYKVATRWGILEDVFCAGNEDLYPFLEDVLSEVFNLFPSEYIHIGGDECPKVRWEVCPKCQARIETEGLKDEHELQSYVIRRMEKFLNKNGRRLIGWDEILEGGLAPNATVMSWRGAQGGIDAATAGHDVVMSPNTYCYLDYYQSIDEANEPPAIGGLVTLEKAYQFDPAEDIPGEKAGHVLGGQGNVWTEYMPTTTQVEYMTNPRASALAEATWSTTERDYENFLQRLTSLLKRFDILQVGYRPLS